MCGGAACAPAVTSTSSTLAVAPGGKALVVTSWDDDALVELDAATLRETRRFAVPKGPAHVLVVDGTGGGTAWVTASLDTAIARVVLGTGTVTRVDVPCGGSGDLARDAVRQRVIVACPNDDRVVLVGDDGTAAGRIDVDGRPSALAVRGDDLFVATSKPPARLLRFALPDVLAALPASNSAPVDDGELAHDGPGPASSNAAVQAAAIAFVNGEPVVAYSVVDHDDRGLPVDEGGYGSVVDGSPRIEPRLTAPCSAHPAVFDGGARVLSGPSSLAVRKDGTVFLAGQFTDSVLALDCAHAGAASSTWIGTVRTGRGPRGLALSDDGRTLFVDAGFDLAVDRVDVSSLAGNLLKPALAVARKLGTSRLSPAARRGRALFADAVNTHITPSGVVTCATCHPDGGEDGVTWFFHTARITPRLRRTQPAWGARDDLAPFHWDGAFSSSTELTKETMQDLLGGDALLVSFDDLAAYMAEAPMSPPRPVEDAALVGRGRALFFDENVGCATCHAGELFADGLRHAVVPASGDDTVDIAGGADTPSLVAVRTRAPYLHDGSAATLEDRLVHNPGDVHGRTSQLSSDDRQALVAFLESL